MIYPTILQTSQISNAIILTQKKFDYVIHLVRDTTAGSCKVGSINENAIHNNGSVTL